MNSILTLLQHCTHIIFMYIYFTVPLILSVANIRSRSTTVLCVSVCVIAASEAMRGSTPLDVAASSVMDNNGLALALEEPDLEKVCERDCTQVRCIQMWYYYP